jgi:nucleotide-binding universal stress UspA family protein
MSNPFEKILVYIDGTEESITAAQYGICLSRKFDAELTALYVVNTQALSRLLKSRIFIQEEGEEYQRELESDGDRYLQHVRSLAREKGVAIETVCARGSVQKEIKNCIKEHNIDLLLLGELSHLRSRRDEFHSETEMAMRRASCSVIIVKDEERVSEIYDAQD